MRTEPGDVRPTAGTDGGVLGRHDDLVDPELGAHDLLLDRDQPLADLGRRRVDGAAGIDR